MTFYLEKLEKLLSIKDKIPNCELEARRIILPINDFEYDTKLTITYYRCLNYPTITFRTYNNSAHIETKEPVEYQTINDTKFCLSIEKRLNKLKFYHPLIYSSKRIIYRKQVEPNVFITKCGYQFLLEIEFDRKSAKNLEYLLSKYSCKYYPSYKPLEISTKKLASKLGDHNNWVMAFKADGRHALLFENDSEQCIVYDNGEIEGRMIDYHTIYEIEKLDDNTLYFDCLLKNKIDLFHLNYLERIEYIPKIHLKEVWSLKEASKVMWYVPPYKTDGFIITNIYKQEIYKSKFKSTVDLRYNNGYLYLENQIISDIMAKNSAELKNNQIYEYDMSYNLIGERNDKIYANYHYPEEDNVLYKLVKSIGIPNLRLWHNKVKYRLLKMLPKSTLLDVGSAKGGDVSKWIQLGFNKIYAVDPNLDLRISHKNIVEINTDIQNLPDFVTFDSVSIFFVPWNDAFIDIINRAKNAVLILMENPIENNSIVFNSSISKNNVLSLQIPGSETSHNVSEYIVDRNNVEKKLVGKLVEISIKPYNIYLSEEEEKLRSTYKYYYVKK